MCLTKKPIKILFEDEQYIVFDKPARILVVPTAKKEKNTLTNIVNKQYVKDSYQSKLYPCHRLDKDTSGVIIYSKGKRNQQLMMDEFKNKKVKKKYCALIHGKLDKIKGEIKSNIKNQQRSKFIKYNSSKPALTRYEVVESRREYSILEVEPVTGRTNQIRIHFSKIGHPLIGDRKFSFARDFTLKFRRAALHAMYLEFSSPITNKKIKINSKIPKDMEEFIERN